MGISGKSRIRVKESIVLEVTCLFYPFFLALSDNRGQTSLLELLFKILFINIFFFFKCDVIMWSFPLVCSQCNKGVPGQGLKHSTKNAQPKGLKVVLIQLSVRKGKQIFFRTELTDVGSICSFLREDSCEDAFRQASSPQALAHPPAVCWRPRISPACF